MAHYFRTRTFSKIATSPRTGVSTVKFPTTMSMSPSLSKSPTSSVAWVGNPLPAHAARRCPAASAPATPRRAGCACRRPRTTPARTRRCPDRHPHRDPLPARVHRRHRRQHVRCKWEGARVFEPPNSVIRLQDLVVERIAVRHQDVEVSVLVEIDDLDPAGPPVRMGRLVDDMRIETASPPGSGTRPPSRAPGQTARSGPVSCPRSDPPDSRGSSPCACRSARGTNEGLS